MALAPSSLASFDTDLFVQDSLHSSKVTLHQIINVYLHLCDNESIGEPEALYVTLSTKLTASAAISELAAAANEGKGLSEIFSWDEYDEVEPFSAGPHAEHPESQPKTPEESEEPREPEKNEEHEEHVPAYLEAPKREAPEAPQGHEKPETSVEPQEKEEAEAAKVPEQGIAEPGEVRDHELQHEVIKETEPDIHEGSHLEQKDQEEDDGKLASNHPGEETEEAGPTAEAEAVDYGEYDEGEYEEEAQEYHGIDLENQVHDHPSNDRSSDSEEQKTESTATIAPLPATDSLDEEQGAEQSVDMPEARHGDDGEYDEIEGIGEEDYSNEETNLDAPEHADHSGESGYDDADDTYDEQRAEKLNEQPSSESREKYQEDEGDESPALQEGVADEPFQGDDEHTVRDQPEDVVVESTHQNTRPTPEREDELLGIAENLMDSPSKNVQDVNGTAEDEGHTDSGDLFNNDAEHVSSVNAEECGIEDLTFDGNDEYINLDFDDEAGPETNVSDVVGHDNVPAKRTRDAEDETELTDTTPGVKRSRSS